MSITVNVIGQTNIVTSITNSDTVDVAIGTMAAQTLTSLAIVGGANVTVTTTSGVFTIIGRDPPVTSVNGKTGVVALVASDVSAASASHTHVVVNITDFATEAAKYGPVSSVNGKTGTVTLVASDVSAASASHTHVVANITDFATEAAKYGPVSSVNGKTGTVTLVATDVTAASATHAHSYVQTLNGQTGTVNIVAGANVTVTTSVGSIAIAAGTGSGNVLSVNGRTGVVVLNSTDVSAASASHTHVVANITDFATEAAKYGPVSSVNGKTGTVTLVATDVTAASATHAHSYVQTLNGQTGTVNIVAGANVTVTTSAGVITIAAAAATGSGNVLSVNGQTGVVVLNSTDVSAASAVHTHVAADITNITAVANVVNVNTITGTPTIVAGANVTVSTAGNQITIAAAGIDATAVAGVASVNGLTGTVTLGHTDVTAAPPFLWGSVSATANLNNYSPGTATVLRITGDAARSVTGFSGGGSNKMLRLVNVATNILTLVHNSTASDSTNRLLLDSGTNRNLDENDQAELLYDPISLRWRVTPCCGVSS